MTEQLGASLWREASDLEDAGMLSAAVERYKMAVCEGSVEAMINLGNIYDDKIDPPNPSAAVALYEQAVKRGSGIAAWNLAQHYQNRGDQDAAAEWMATAANLGDADAKDWMLKHNRQ